MNYDPSEVKKLREQHALLQAELKETKDLLWRAQVPDMVPALQAEVDGRREHAKIAGARIDELTAEVDELKHELEEWTKRGAITGDEVIKIAEDRDRLRECLAWVVEGWGVDDVHVLCTEGERVDCHGADPYDENVGIYCDEHAMRKQCREVFELSPVQNQLKENDDAL